MSGDPVVERMVLRAEILSDLAAVCRSVAVVYRVGTFGLLFKAASRILSVVADKLDLRASTLEEDAREMTR